MTTTTTKAKALPDGEVVTIRWEGELYSGEVCQCSSQVFIESLADAPAWGLWLKHDELVDVVDPDVVGGWLELSKFFV